jgi:hypothetical protein
MAETTEPGDFGTLAARTQRVYGTVAGWEYEELLRNACSFF